jgi:subtilisin
MYVFVGSGTQVRNVDTWLASLTDESGRPVRVQRFPEVELMTADLSPAQVEDGRGRGFSIELVRLLRPPFIRQSGDLVAAEEFLRQAPALWNHVLLGRDAFTATGEGVKVGHIDTGITPEHPLLSGHPAAFATFTQNGNQVDEDYADQPFDFCGHGTETASVLCGQYLGIAPKVSLYCAALVGIPWTEAQVAAAAGWMRRVGVSVVWLGVERPTIYSTILEQCMAQMRAANILPITAVGNEGAGTSSTPGNTRHGFSAGAVCEGKAGPVIWNWSGSRRRPDELLKPDVVAPGCDVYAARCLEKENSVDYLVQFASGTSIAGPQLAGLAALCLQEDSRLTPDQLIEGIEKGSRLFALDRDRANYGVPYGPDVIKALGL